MLNWISFENFAGIKDGARFEQLGKVVQVCGMNGQGKTSFGRAIRWALTGMDSGLVAAGDRYKADPSKPVQVALELADGTLVTRRRTAKGATFTVNGTALTEAMAEQHFLKMPSIVWACMFWPEAFLRLESQKQRDLFMRITPDEDVRALFAQRCKQPLSDLEWALPPKKLFEKYAAARLAKERDIAYKTGENDAVWRQLQDSPSPDASVAQLQAAWEEADALLGVREAELAKLNEWKVKAEENARAQLKWQREKQAYENVLAENAKRRFAAITGPDVSGIKAAIKEASKLIDSHGLAYALKFDEKKALEKQIAEAVVPETCIKCGQPWPFKAPDTGHLHIALAEVLKAAAKEKSAIAFQTEVRERLQNELAQAEAEARELGPTQSLPVPPAPGTAPEAMAMPPDDVVRKAIADRDEAFKAAFDLKVRLEAFKKNEASITAAQQKRAALQKEIMDGRLELERLAATEAALHPKTGIFAEALQLKLAKVALPGFKFQFSEALANGDERECFKIVRDSDGVPIQDLSSGEQIKFCMSLSRLIADLGACPPELRICFLEHADLLDEVPAMPDFQVFLELVTNNPLQVFGSK